MGWDNKDSPLVQGNIIKIVADDTTIKTRYFSIVSNVANGAGSTITINAPASTYSDNGALTKIVLDVLQNVNDPADANTAPTKVSTGLWDYQVENVEFVVRTIDMPPDYLNGIQRRIQSEGSSS